VGHFSIGVDDFRWVTFQPALTVTEGELNIHASMLCPEGCGAIINLNLLPDDNPCWRLIVDDRGKPTLHPSVWRREECGAHFFMRSGQIIWCR
jgi:hypothetical protein